MDDQQKIQKISKNIREILETLGLDLEEHSIKKTPERVARMYVKELFRGLDPKNFPKVVTTKDDFYKKREGMILIRNVKVHSTCEHHLVPIIGVAYIGYVSHGRILGLSKVNRIVDFFCKKPQLQERLTAEIADCFSTLLKTPDIAVLIKAQHFCVVTRGIQDANSDTVTHLLLGKFKTDSDLHEEFLGSVARSD